MCTISTATPAATDGSPRAVRKQSSGRSRFPPAASASPATSCDEPGPRRDRAREPRLDLRHVRRDAGRRVHLRERHSTATPGVQRDDRAAEQAEAHVAEPVPAHAARASASASGNRFTDAGRYVYAEPPGSTLPSSGTIRSNQSEKNGRRMPRGCVISRIARRPPGRRTRRSSRQPELEVGDVAHAEADRGRVEGAVVERQREQVAAHPVDLRALAARALEHALGEVEAGHCGRARPSGRRAQGRRCRTRRRARASPGWTTASAASRRQRHVEPDGHHAVHQVVDRRDPVEHRADGVGRERHAAPTAG